MTVKTRRTLSDSRSRRAGFTLVEMLIAIVAMLIIAGMVIPQFQNAVLDAKRSSTLGNLHMLTMAIEGYKIYHNGYSPDILQDDSLPQLTSTTNMLGDVGKGPEFSFGPYVNDKFPVNPLNRSNKVVLATVVPPPNLDKLTGWIYDPNSGRIWAGEDSR